MLSTKEIIGEVQKLVELFETNNNLYRVLHDTLRLEPENPILDTLDKNFENSVRLVSMATGIGQDAIEWFIWDNLCGKNKFKASKKGKKTIIKDAKSFVKFELS